MTAEHCLQAHKFLPDRPDIAQFISAQPTRQAIFDAVEAYSRFGRQDWTLVRVGIMENILRAKLDCNPEVEKLLMETGGREIVYDGPVRITRLFVNDHKHILLFYAAFFLGQRSR
jgi:predicted NAD-dependent protein-ADP-ribosyltransferase YbiA (DUF1768 family)